MKTSKKQTENLAESGNKLKPLLAVVFSDEDIEKLAHNNFPYGVLPQLAQEIGVYTKIKKNLL